MEVAELELKDLHIAVGDRHLIEGLSATIEAGSFVGLVGANGCGKSLLLQTIRGLRAPDRGSIFYKSAELAPKKIHDVCAFAVQDPLSHFVGVSVEEDLNFAMRTAAKGGACADREAASTREAMDKLIDRFGIRPLLDRSPSTLSGGEKRKVLLAGIIAQGADILLLDEPFSALDRPACSELLELLVELNREGLTIIMATHRLEGLLAHLTHLILLQEGQAGAYLVKLQTRPATLQ